MIIDDHQSIAQITQRFSTHKNQMYPEKRERRWCRGEDDRKSKGWLRFPLI